MQEDFHREFLSHYADVYINKWHYSNIFKLFLHMFQIFRHEDNH